MGPMDFFWLFVMLVAIQPILRQKWLEASRQRLISRVEAERGSRAILLVHRQETMSLLGFPLMRYIDVQDSEQVLRAIDMTDNDVPIDLVLHTPGGLVLASTQIARALQAHPAPVTVFVPHYAMSGGTLIALAADRIVMSRHAVLGPVDPQIGQMPAASLRTVVERKPIGQIDDETLVLADQGEKATRQVHHLVRDLLEPKMDPARADETAGLLSRGAWTHDYPITCDTAEQLALPVSTGIPPSLLQLLELYPQPTRRQRGVEYIPERRRAPAPGGRNGAQTSMPGLPADLENPPARH